MQSSWSLHLLSEILSSFSTEDPDNLLSLINRVAEAVDAEVAAIVTPEQIDWCIGLTSEEREGLRATAREHPATISIRAGELHTYWAPIGSERQLVVGRLEEAFDLEERSLMRAMARSIELSLRMLEAISSERQARIDASYQACHDPLTALPNRILVIQTLTNWLEESVAGDDTVIAVLFIDIDRFKWVNDAHGHAAGDSLLVHASRILRNVVRKDDLVGRLSGDEFIVITRACNRDAVVGLAQRILTAIRQPIRVAGSELSHSASVGIYFAHPEDSASLVIENADMAMYRAKAQGRGKLAVFQSGLRDEARERLAMESTLRQAVEQGGIQAYLQPVVRLHDRRLMGFEALVRWHHPRKGLIMPASFISTAEDSGLIEEIDLKVFAIAVDAVSRWQRLPNLEHLRLTSNISARTLASNHLPDRLNQILATSGVNPALVYLEITETLLVDDIKSTEETIQRLSEIGIRLAIDDFGTGYSSLLYLKRFPVGLLKIDQSFVADLGRDQDNEAIAQAIVSLARALGVQVVAEGVETADQHARLLQLGSDFGQGYLYGHPQPIPQLESTLIAAASRGNGEP